MNDFHNQINGYSSQNHFSPFHSTLNKSITDPSDNKEGTHPIHHPSKTAKQTEGNQTVKQERILSSSNNRTEERTSHPLLFTPPLVVDRLVEEKNNQQQLFQLNDPSEEKKYQDSKLDHTEPSFQIGNLLNEEENEHLFEDESSPSTNVESSLYEELEDQFIAMLEESSSHFAESSSSYEESSSQFEESSSFFEESSSQFDESSSFFEESSSQSEESPSFFEESSSQSEESSSFYEESSSQSEESSSFYEESSSQSEESSSFYEESSSQSEESSSFYEESSSQSEESPSFYEESSSQSEESPSFYEESSSQSEESPSFYEESSSQFEESPSFYEESSSQFEDPSLMESSSGQNEIMESNFEVSSLKRTLPIVKIPVLLANLDFDIDLFDSFQLEIPIENISKIDWHVHSFDCKVLLPSPNVFLKGLLIADLTYVNNNKTSSLHSMKLNIPIDKVIKIDWFYLPELPSSHQVEYMYQGNEDMEVQFHREFSQQFAEPIQSELQNVYIIWHDELISNGGLRELDIQGKVRISMTLLQSQYVDLDDLYG